MAVPATTGILRAKIEDMEIGDYIALQYYPNLNSVRNDGFRNLGDTSVTEMPYTGVNTNSQIYYFYLIKVNRGLLISDRVIHHSVSWDNINTNKFIQGLPTTLGGVNGVIRSLTGGVAYADENGNSSTTNKGLGGFPTSNEWDKHIVNFSAELIQSGKTLDDVFHWSEVFTWTQDTINVALNSNIYRAIRGKSNVNLYSWTSSPASTNSFGFRPVFAYNENQFAQ